MLTDLPTIFSWWLLLFGLGAICFPLAWFLFHKFFDSGYAFSKIIAILLLSYLVWLTGSLRILPFSIQGIWLIVLFLVFINYRLAKKIKNEFGLDLKNKLRIFILEETIFFFALASWSFIRGFQPDIEGLEKFMDFGFVNSILRSQFFPPADMWMAGETINYYYFGHLVAAVLTKISTIDSATTYNLMIATIFGMAITGTFSLSGNLLFFTNKISGIKLYVGAILSSALLSVGGNMHTFWWFLNHDGINKFEGLIKSLVLGNPFAANSPFSSYWYPDATRFIVEKFGANDNTIHEFPLYSFVVSDLHGHVSDIPFVLLFLAMALSFLVQELNLKSLVPNLKLLIPPALVLAVMYMTNSWDFPIYLMILGLVILWKNYQQSGFSLETLYRTFSFSIGILLAALVFSLPFHLHFSQIAKGIAPVHAQTPLWQFFVLWGFPWAIGLISLLFFVLKGVGHRFVKKGGVAIFSTDVFVLILFSVATLLIVVPEFLYVKDIYIDSYHRANTMFKLVYQSFMIYALACGYLIIRVLSEINRGIRKFLLVFTFALLTSFVLLYPNMAIRSYYGDFRVYRGIWGLPFMKNSYPENFAVSKWLNQNVKGQPVILEAVGDSYTEYNQISMATGLPTVEGWLVHEWLWRGSFDEPGKRSGEVQSIYETEDQTLAKQLIDKYQVKYVIVGILERKKYQVSEEKFSRIGRVVFQQKDTSVYLVD